MDLLSHYLSYQAPPMSAPLINVDHLRELLYRLKYMNLNATHEETFENVQKDSLPAFLPNHSPQFDRAEENLLMSPGYPESVESLQCISRKVFVGGLPQDISKSSLLQKFCAYGQVRLDFPSEPTHPPRTRKADRRLSTSGYVFLIYETEEAVFNLLKACSFRDGSYFLPFHEDSMNVKLAQVRPWQLASITYIPNIDAMIDTRLTVFIGGVPRPLTSGELAALLEQNYGPLLYCEIDVDPELFYPKGAARAVFASYSSYVKAIRSRYLHIPNVEFNKRTVEIKPYTMDEILCDECLEAAATHFCRVCMQYYCEACSIRMDHSVGSHLDSPTEHDFDLPNNLLERLAECSI
ncbi:hypothetical protein ANCCEY_02284 [Ancylostoma ceylanicum]|uniref:RRM domain-containing protein n=1 Tax=Ancylostoma ceylanicum TaxID=53326 RepID=A0A0D6M871_9BILA|nr:hypothetical protein ANCCEY_02284 [Ancylostoma ceylanicum]